MLIPIFKTYKIFNECFFENYKLKQNLEIDKFFFRKNNNIKI